MSTPQRSMFYEVVIALMLVYLSSWSPALAQVSAPTISPSTGSFNTQQTVTMSASSGTIYFTLNGTQPTTSSTQYTTALTVTSPTQINAVAYSSGTYSSVTTAYLDVDPNLVSVLAPGSLALRLRAGFGIATNPGSPAPIVTWNDLSGNGSNATATTGIQPSLFSSAINCLPAANFNGSQYFTLPSGFANFTDGLTAFVITAPSSLTANAHMVDLGSGNTNEIVLQIASSGSLAQFSSYNGSSPTSADSASALTQGQYQLVEVNQAPGTSYGTAIVYVNGTPGTANSSMNNFPNSTRTNNFLGASSSGNLFSGGIAEVLLYSTSLTESQHAAIVGYLMQKYQIQSQIPPAPILSVATSTLNSPTNVVISAQPGTQTFFTVDGTTPSPSSPAYLGSPIPINYSQTLKAISILNGVSSSVTSATYTLNSTQWPAPSLSDTTAPSINLQLPIPTQ